MADTEIEPIQFPLECTVHFDAGDVVATLKPAQIADLIIELDEEAGEWEVSLRAYHHFKRQFEVALEKRPDLAALTADELEERLADMQPSDSEAA